MPISPQYHELILAYDRANAAAEDLRKTAPESLELLIAMWRGTLTEDPEQDEASLQAAWIKAVEAASKLPVEVYQTFAEYLRLTMQASALANQIQQADAGRRLPQ